MQMWVDACTGMEKEKMKELCMPGKEDECADLYYNIIMSYVYIYIMYNYALCAFILTH